MVDTSHTSKPKEPVVINRQIKFDSDDEDLWDDDEPGGLKVPEQPTHLLAHGCVMPRSLRERIYRLLVKFPEGMDPQTFNIRFSQYYQTTINPSRNCNSTLLEVFFTLSDIVDVHYNEKTKVALVRAKPKEEVTEMALRGQRFSTQKEAQATQLNEKNFQVLNDWRSMGSEGVAVEKSGQAEPERKNGDACPAVRAVEKIDDSEKIEQKPSATDGPGRNDGREGSAVETVEQSNEPVVAQPTFFFTEPVVVGISKNFSKKPDVVPTTTSENQNFVDAVYKLYDSSPEFHSGIGVHQIYSLIRPNSSEAEMLIHINLIELLQNHPEKFNVLCNRMGVFFVKSASGSRDQS